jgi:hypothetical protein
VLSDCRKKIIEAAPEIADALIAQAKSGSCPHAKFLFDFADAIPEKPKDDDDDLPGPSLAEILLERLQIVEEEESGTNPEGAALA